MSKINVRIRFAKESDKDEVLSFTERTWEWGDYIKYVWDIWIRDRSGKLFVAEVNGKPVGILHVAFLPDGSAWLEGLRVHPSFRRKGIAYKLNLEALQYIKENGYHLIRLAIAKWNKPPQKLAHKLGFKELCCWESFDSTLNKLPKVLPKECKIETNIDFLWRKITKS